MRALLAFLLMFLAFACENTPSALAPNKIKDNYRSSLERWPSGELSRLVPPDGKIQVVTSKSIDDDADRMMENGYLLLGRSKFQSEQIDPSQAREVAKDLNASVVLVKEQYAKTILEAVPVERWIPARGAPERGAAAGTLHGEFRMTYQRKPVEYYDYSATFWAKSKPPIFGVLVEGTGVETTTTQDQNGQQVTGKGVVVRAVINDSPASTGGLRKGDIMTKFAGEELSNADTFFDLVVANKGKEVEIEIVRVEGEAKVMKLTVVLKNE